MNFGKLFHRALSVALLSAAAAACAAAATARAETYRSPLNNFSLPVPSGLGMKADEGHSQEGGRVSFHDDFGNLSAVTYWRLPADRVETLADPAQRDDAYARTLHGNVMPTMFTPVSQRARVLREEFLGQPGPDREYFAVVDLPEGSPLMNMTAGRRMDAVRALLIFETNGFLYMLEQEIGAGFMGLGQARPSGAERGTPPDAAALDSARDGLHAFRGTISFGSRGRRNAVAQTAGEPTLTDSQRAARLRAWGNGPEVRFAPSRTAEVFQQTSEQFAAALPTQGAGDGVLDGARVRHPRLATSLPLESTPCRLIWFKQFDEGVGAFAIYVCRPDQPLAYATISFEAVPPGHERRAIELAAAEERGLGVGPPVCEPVAPSLGFEPRSFCESRFTQTGGTPDAGRVFVVAGERPGYFFKVQTACLGAQCTGARPAFEALIANLTFAP